MKSIVDKSIKKADNHLPSWSLEQELDFVFKLLGSENDLIATSPKGVVLRVSELYEDHFGLEKGSAVGRSIYDLERMGIFRPSVTVVVLQEKRMVTLVQETKAAGKILSTGIPVFDSDNKIKYVVSFSSVSFYSTKTPLERFEKLLSIVETYNTELKSKQLLNIENENLIFYGDYIKRINEIILHISDTNANVLLTGETGVGKSMIARIIHKSSLRASGPFIEINCGAIPESLMESELFGYVGGAFTGSDSRGRMGLIQAAEGGTLFLDEIGEMPLNMQLRLLQVLQEKKIFRVGSSEAVQVDFRLISATNRDLEHEVEQGRFRRDLFYRIHVIPIYVPALRERREEIIPLATHFLNYYNRKYKRQIILSQQQLSLFEQYDWPGNIRQLENEIERIVIMSNDNLSAPPQISQDMLHNPSNQGFTPHIDGEKTFQELIEEYERQIFTKVYEKEKTSIAVGRALKISQTNAARKLRKYVPEYNKSNKSG